MVFSGYPPIRAQICLVVRRCLFSRCGSVQSVLGAGSSRLNPPPAGFSCEVSFTCCAVIGRRLGELALQEDSGDTEALLLVDRLPQNVVIGHEVKARLLEELSQELCEQTGRRQLKGRSLNLLFLSAVSECWRQRNGLQK